MFKFLTKFILFISLSSAVVAEDKGLKEQLIEVLRDCKASKVRERPKFYSKEFLVSRMAAVLTSKDDERVLFYSKMNNDLINVCSTVGEIYDAKIKALDFRTNITLTYASGNKKDRSTGTFGLIRENGDWVISFVSADL